MSANYKQGICSNCGDDEDDLDEFDVCSNCREEEYDEAGLDGSSI